MIAAALALLPLTAQATSYTWTGTTSNAWALATNWGGSGFPNSYSDQATIPSTGANRPVTLSTTALLGIASGNALTISGAASGTTSNSLDIASGGLLGMQGGISIGTRRTLIIDTGGTLRNDAASSATTYTISGSPILNGGTISSLNGGKWSVSGISGYGTISAPITTAGIISNNVANQTLHITGDVTTSAQRGLGGTSTFASGALLSIEGGNITGTGSGSGITNYNLVNLRGNFNGITLYNDGNYNQATPGDWNYYNLTGNSTWNNGALNIIKFNGYKLDVTGTVTNFASSGLGVNVGTGTLNNPGLALTTISNGNTMTLAGGHITGALGSAGFSFGTNIKGYGTFETPVTFTANGGLQVSGGTLAVSAPLNASAVGASNASDGTVHIINTTATWGNFTNNGAYISDPSTQTFNTLTVGSTGYLTGGTGDVFQIKGNFTNNSTQNTLWNTAAAELDFIAGTSNAHTFALAGADMGNSPTGGADNFAWGALKLDPSQTLALSDGNLTPGAALYVLGLISGLDINGSTVNDITGNGFNIYYDASLNPDLLGLTYSLGSGGFLEPLSAAAVPIPPSALLLGTGLLGLVGLGWRRRKFSQA
jgi:hypothetical protein